MSADAEGDELMAKARKAHTKTLFNWTADWASAMVYYEQAANAFKKDVGVGCQVKAVEALRQASKAAEELSNTNAAAKHLSTAAAISLKFGDKDGAITLMISAAKLYQENTQARKAAEELAKAAGWIRDDNPDQAYALYSDACDIYETEGQTQMAQDLYRTTLAFLIRENRLSDAIELLRKQNTGLLKHIESFSEAFNKNSLNICILHLACRETEKAVTELSEFQSSASNFLNSNEGACAQALVSAFKECDPDALMKAKTDRTLNYVDNQIARLARDLAIDDEARESAKKVGAAVASGGDEIDLT